MKKLCYSTTTGAVLPFNKKLAERPNIRVIPYEEGLLMIQKRDAARRGRKEEILMAPPPAVEEPVPDEAPRVLGKPRVVRPPREAAVQVTDVSDGEPSVEDLLQDLAGE